MNMNGYLCPIPFLCADAEAWGTLDGIVCDVAEVGSQ